MRKISSSLNLISLLHNTYKILYKNIVLIMSVTELRTHSVNKIKQTN